jgi:hypothetical protein
MKGQMKVKVDSIKGLTENRDSGGHIRPFGGLLSISDPSMKDGSIDLSDTEGSRIICCDFGDIFK